MNFFYLIYFFFFFTNIDSFHIFNKRIKTTSIFSNAIKVDTPSTFQYKSSFATPSDPSTLSDSSTSSSTSSTISTPLITKYGLRIPNQGNLNVLLTGGSSGIGKSLVKDLFEFSYNNYKNKGKNNNSGSSAINYNNQITFNLYVTVRSLNFVKNKIENDEKNLDETEEINKDIQKKLSSEYLIPYNVKDIKNQDEKVTYYDLLKYYNIDIKKYNDIELIKKILNFSLINLTNKKGLIKFFKHYKDEKKVNFDIFINNAGVGKSTILLYYSLSHSFFLFLSLSIWISDSFN